MAIVSPAPGWLAGVGFTLPIGKTEENPIVLGRLGLKHEHIQFGTGTVDPRLLLGWSRAFGRVGVEALADARLPLYENGHGYKGPITIQYKAGPGMVFGRAAVSLAFAGQYQSIARWKGEKDEGTGFHNGGVFLGVSLDAGKGFNVAPGVYREIFSHSLSGETFHQGDPGLSRLREYFPRPRVLFPAGGSCSQPVILRSAATKDLLRICSKSREQILRGACPERTERLEAVRADPSLRSG